MPLHPPKPTPASDGRLSTAVSLREFDGTFKLIAQFLYGSGLRLLESLRLCVEDLDFTGNKLPVREGKGNNDRVLGSASVETTMVYLHVLNKGGRGVTSPADRLLDGGGGPALPPGRG